MNIFLIGYRCTGKTSVGKNLARIIGWQFIDADAKLVKDYGMSIKEIVARLGWDAFRAMECNIIKKICFLDQHIVATGGGAVLNSDNVKNMKSKGPLIWLRATPETIEKRIVADENTEELRPALTSKGLTEEINEVLLNRNPAYENTMDFYIDTDRLDINEISQAIIKKIKKDIRQLNKPSMDTANHKILYTL